MTDPSTHTLDPNTNNDTQEISKSNVVDDMVASNRLLYKEDEHPDHVVVIKCVPSHSRPLNNPFAPAVRLVCAHRPHASIH